MANWQVGSGGKRVTRARYAAAVTSAAAVLSAYEISWGLFFVVST